MITNSHLSNAPTVDRDFHCKPPTERIRVLVVGKGIYAELLTRELSGDPAFDAVSAGFEEVATALSRQGPHVAVIDAASEEELLKGSDLVRQVVFLLPQTQIVLLLESSRPELTLEAFRAGANGILSRKESLDSLKKCICCVHSGQVWASGDQIRLMLETLRNALPTQLIDFSGRPLLSKREQDVVRGIAEGMTNREIAEHLKLSTHTVKNYVFRIFDRLGVSNRVEVVQYAVRQASQSGRQAAPFHDLALTREMCDLRVPSAEDSVPNSVEPQPQAVSLGSQPM